GVEGGGINPMRGQNNIQGAGDAGAIPNSYAGFQPVDIPENQAKFEALYGRPLDSERGMTKVSALEQAGESIFAMLIDGENTLVSDPDRTHGEHALKSLDHLVVIDIFLTETAALAHVVLPATAWAETDGHFTNSERRIQRVRRAVTPPGEAKPDWWIVSALATRLGFAGFEYDSPKEVFNELCRVSPIYAGIDWEMAEKGEYQWPIPYKGHPGTPRLHEDEFINGRGIFRVINYRDPAEVVDAAYPVWLTTGRRLQTYHTRTQTGRAQGIEYFVPEEVLEVHPDNVAAWGLQDGGWATMRSRRGSIRIKVKATERSPRGTVFASFAFNETPVNILTGSGYDPITQTAELKVCPVRVEAYEEVAGPA
ncbi:MAG: molybdopterin-dependent oxidoreductase, partial [Caldilineaceae bacterium]|nr:molybdopterin-dependent oxidoreductase [Caldilineaceae bacterium]